MEAKHTPGPKIEAFLLRMQRRELRRGGDGVVTTRDVAQAVGMRRDDCRCLLREMAGAGRVRREVASNGEFWRAIAPLPWERAAIAKAEGRS
jgi:predicted transcriptional regulator of viral defense system